MDSRKKASEKMRIMVVGSSGTSQFLLTNYILGRKVFSKDVTGIHGSTKTIGELAGRPVAVVNCPNIYEKDISQAKRKMELRRSKCLSAPGPHVLLAAFDLERISPNDMKTPKLVMKHFGENSLRHCIVLLAYEGHLEGPALDDRVLKTNWHLSELIEKFGGRFHVFGKNWRDGSRDKELLQKIERMIASLGGRFFTSKTFQKAEDWVRKEEKKLRKGNAYNSSIDAEIRAKAEMDNGWLRTSMARGLGMGIVAGAAMGVLVGSVEGPAGMVLYGIIGGAVGGTAGGSAQVAIEHMEYRVAPTYRVNFNSVFINRFFTSTRS